jgi:hypothetical protein
VSPGVALDLSFDAKRDDFEVHGFGLGTGMTLKHALEIARLSASEPRLLLRLSDLQEGNAASVVKALTRLDEEYGYGRRTILLTAYDGLPVHSLERIGLTIATISGTNQPTVDSGGTAIMASYQTGRPWGKTGFLATARESSTPTIVELDADPSNPAFVESISRLNEIYAGRGMAVVLPALSRYEQHF